MDKPRTAAEELAEVTRTAHAATKDLRAAIKEAQAVKKTAIAEIEKLVAKTVSAELEQIAPQVRETIEKAQQKVMDEFDELGKLLTTGKANGKGEHLFEMRVRKIVQEALVEVITEARKFGDPDVLLRDMRRVVAQ